MTQGKHQHDHGKGFGRSILMLVLLFCLVLFAGNALAASITIDMSTADQAEYGSNEIAIEMYQVATFNNDVWTVIDPFKGNDDIAAVISKLNANETVDNELSTKAIEQADLIAIEYPSYRGEFGKIGAGKKSYKSTEWGPGVYLIRMSAPEEDEEGIQIYASPFLVFLQTDVTVEPKLTTARDITFIKTWDDDDDKANDRPSLEEFVNALSLRAYYDETHYDDVTAKYAPSRFASESANTYTVTWKRLPVSQLIDGLKRNIRYVVVEDAIENYTADSTTARQDDADPNVSRIINTRDMSYIRIAKTVRVDDNGRIPDNLTYKFTVTSEDGNICYVMDSQTEKTDSEGNTYFEGYAVKADGTESITVPNGTYVKMIGVPTGKYKVTELTAENDLPVFEHYVLSNTYINSEDQPASSVTIDNKDKDSGTLVNVINDYTRKTGNLEVHKTVLRKNRQETDQFTFDITVNDALNDNRPVTGDFTAKRSRQGSSTTETVTFDENGKLLISLCANDNVVVTGLPEGAVYTVEEKEVPDDFALKEKTGDTGTISSEHSSVAEFVNEYNTSVNAQIEGIKELKKGAQTIALQQGQFGFILTPVDGAPMPGDQESIRVENEEDGSFSFPVFTYDLDNLPEGGNRVTFKYNVEEDKSDTDSDTKAKDNIKYDERSYEVTVALEYNKATGVLTATVSPQANKVKFTNRVETTSVDAEKIWKNTKDSNVSMKIAETTLTLTLSGMSDNGEWDHKDADGNDVEYMAYLTSDSTSPNKWKHNWSNLPKYDAQGKVITYTVTESDVRIHGEEVDFQNNLTVDGYKLTNKYPVRTIDASKIWDDDNNEAARPESITFHLFRNGKEMTDKKVTITKDAEGKWEHTWEDLDVYADDGTKYVYTVTEDHVPQYIATVPVGNEENNYQIRNKLLTDSVTVEGTKTYIGEDLKTEDFSFVLKSVTSGRTYEETVKNQENGSFAFTPLQYSIEDLLKDKDGNYQSPTILKYQVYEVLPTDANEENGFVSEHVKYDSAVYDVEVTLTYDPVAFTFDADAKTKLSSEEKEIAFVNEKLQDLSVNKQWFLASDAANDINDTIQNAVIVVELRTSDDAAVTADATGKEIKPVKLNGKENWTYTWVNLPIKTDKGEEIVYKIAETEASINGTPLEAAQSVEAGGILRNELPTTEIDVSKTWDDEGNQDSRPNQITFVLKANGDTVVETQVVNVAADGSASYAWKDLDKYDKTGTEIAYTVDEQEVPYYVKRVTSNENDFTITNTFGGVVIEGKKEIKNNSKGVVKPFTFIMTAQDGAPLNGKEQLTTTNLEDGTFAFEALKYQLSDLQTSGGTYVDTEYTYIIKEDLSGVDTSTMIKDGYKYDNNEISVVVKLHYDEENNSIDASVVDDLEHPVRFINEELRTISAKKEWNDNGHAGVNHPSIQFQLYEQIGEQQDSTTDRAEGEPQTPNEANSWTVTWENLDRAKTYYVVETSADTDAMKKFRVAYSGNMDDGFTVTNTYDEVSVPFTAQKVMKSGRALSDEDTFSFSLTPKDGAPGTAQTKTNATDGSITFAPVTIDIGDLDGAEEKTFKYEISEVPGDNKLIVYDDKVYTVTVTVRYSTADSKLKYEQIVEGGTPIQFTNDELTEVSVEKTWDQNGVPADPDAKATVVLRIGENDVTEDYDGNPIEPVILEKGKWTYTWERLPKYDGSQLIQYTVAETQYEIGGDTWTPENLEAEEGVIKNPLPKVSITLWKSWEGDGDHKEHRRNVIITLLRSNGTDEEVVESWEVDVSDGANRTYKVIDNLPAYDADGNKYTYHVTETPVLSEGETYNGGVVVPYYTVILPGAKAINKPEGATPPPDTASLAFEVHNVYETAQVTLGGLKKMKAGDHSVAYFSFRLEAVTEGAPMPAATEASSDTTGAFTFDGITYTLEDLGRQEDGVNYNTEKIYEYRIAEIEPEGTVDHISDDVRYDQHTETVQVTLKYNASTGALSAECSKTPEEVVFTNEELTDITVDKRWYQLSGRDEMINAVLKNASVDVSLFANGTIVEDSTVTLDGTVDAVETVAWHYEWLHLPKYDDDGAIIAYTVEEANVKVNIPAEADSQAEPDTLPAVAAEQVETGWFIISNPLPSTTVSARKVWYGAPSNTTTFPAITFTLHGEENVTYDTKTIPANAPENARTVTWENLPRYTREGTTISYTVTESVVANYVPNYSAPTVTENGITYTVTNIYAPPSSASPGSTTPGRTVTPTPVPVNGGGGGGGGGGGRAPTPTPEPTPTPTPMMDIVGQKIWIDDNNEHGLRPSNIAVSVYANGQPINANVNLSGLGGTWSYSASNLPSLDENGNPISYSFVESSVEGYETSVNGTIIVNRLIERPPTEVRDMVMEKQWDDDNNANGDRPSMIQIDLLRNGEVIDTVTVSAAGGWSYDFTDLPQDDGYGNKYTYTMQEHAVDGYYMRLVGNTMTNSRIPTETEPPRMAFDDFSMEDLEELLDISDYETPLFGILGTGNDIPVYIFVLGGVGILAILLLVIFGRKKKAK